MLQVGHLALMKVTCEVEIICSKLTDLRYDNEMRPRRRVFRKWDLYRNAMLRTQMPTHKDLVLFTWKITLFCLWWLGPRIKSTPEYFLTFVSYFL